MTAVPPSRRLPGVLVVAVSIAAVLLGASAWIRAQGPQAQPVAGPPKAADARLPRDGGAEGPADLRAPQDRGEQLAAAREDVRALELKLSAVRAEVRAAELRRETERINAANTARLNKKGMASGFSQQAAEMQSATAEARYQWKQAELVEVENEFERARRRVAALQARGPDAVLPLDGLERFLLRLDERVHRLERAREELDHEVHDLKARVRGIEILLKINQ